MKVNLPQTAVTVSAAASDLRMTSKQQKLLLGGKPRSISSGFVGVATNKKQITFAEILKAHSLINNAGKLQQLTTAHNLSKRDRVEFIQLLDVQRNELMSQINAVNRVYSIKIENLSSGSHLIDFHSLRKTKKSAKREALVARRKEGEDTNQAKPALEDEEEACSHTLAVQTQIIIDIDRKMAAFAATEADLEKEIARIKALIQIKHKAVEHHDQLRLKDTDPPSQQPHHTAGPPSSPHQRDRLEISSAKENVRSTRGEKIRREELLLVVEGQIDDIKEQCAQAAEDLEYAEQEMGKSQVDTREGIHVRRLRGADAEERVKTAMKGLKSNRLSEEITVKKFVTVLENLQLQIEEKDQYIKYFDAALKRANEEMHRRESLAATINPEKFRQLFPPQKKQEEEDIFNQQGRRAEVNGDLRGATSESNCSSEGKMNMKDEFKYWDQQKQVSFTPPSSAAPSESSSSVSVEESDKRRRLKMMSDQPTASDQRLIQPKSDDARRCQEAAAAASQVFPLSHIQVKQLERGNAVPLTAPTAAAASGRKVKKVELASTTYSEKDSEVISDLRRRAKGSLNNSEEGKEEERQDTRHGRGTGFIGSCSEFSLMVEQITAKGGRSRRRAQASSMDNVYNDEMNDSRMQEEAEKRERRSKMNSMISPALPSHNVSLPSIDEEKLKVVRIQTEGARLRSVSQLEGSMTMEIFERSSVARPTPPARRQLNRSRIASEASQSSILDVEKLKRRTAYAAISGQSEYDHLFIQRQQEEGLHSVQSPLRSDVSPSFQRETLPSPTSTRKVVTQQSEHYTELPSPLHPSRPYFRTSQQKTVSSHQRGSSSIHPHPPQSSPFTQQYKLSPLIVKQTEQSSIHRRSRSQQKQSAGVGEGSLRKSLQFSAAAGSSKTPIEEDDEDNVDMSQFNKYILIRKDPNRIRRLKQPQQQYND